MDSVPRQRTAPLMAARSNLRDMSIGVADDRAAVAAATAGVSRDLDAQSQALRQAVSRFRV